MSNNVSISAIVVSYHGIDFVPDCLGSLKADLTEHNHEIIVVDNNSTDGTVEFIEENHPDVKLIKNDRNSGFARAINQGINAARHDYLWLLNQDIRIRRGCLDALLDCRGNLERPGVIGPRLIGFDGKLQKFCRRFPRYHHLLFELSGLAYLFPGSGFFNAWKMGDFDHTYSRVVEQPMGAAMLVTRDLIDEVGLFDESFGIFFNDVDFCRRLHLAGYSNYYCTDAVIEHYGGGSVSRQKTKMIWLGHIGMFKYFKKQEQMPNSSLPIRLIRMPLPYFAGILLLTAAVPRAMFHLIKRFI